MVKEIAAAKVAKQADLGERGGELCILRRDTHVAGKGQRQAGNRRGQGITASVGLGISCSQKVFSHVTFHWCTLLMDTTYEGNFYTCFNYSSRLLLDQRSAMELNQ